MKPEKRHELESLLVLSLEGQATDDQMSHLNSIIKSDIEMQQYCVHFLTVVSCLRCDPRISDVALREFFTEEYDAEVWRALAENERTAVAVHIEKPEQDQCSFESAFAEKRNAVARRRQISKFSLYTFMVSSAALFFILVLVLFTPAKPPIVAVLYQSIGAQWGESEQSVQDGDYIREGDLTLLRGLAEITFESGAVVVIEGPAEVRFESKGQMFLAYGKLSSRVPKSAVGFTVRTPEATIVDYGTEFGVVVGRNGQTETHVFRGEVELRAGSNPLVFEQSSRVTEGQAKLLNSQTGRMEDVKIRGKSFARRICPEIGFVWHGEDFDLADVIGGGNGFGTGRVGCGIDVNSGDLFTCSELMDQGWSKKDTSFAPQEDSSKSNGQYNPALSNPYVDGVFVPDGGDGLCVVSSADHVFADCPDTSGNYYIGVVNSGSLLKNKYSRSSVSLFGLHDMILKGQSYGTRQNPGFFVHSNMGITFDLDAIRSALPGISVTGFRSLCGISDRDISPNKADFWVLVDGVKRFEAIGMTRSSSVEQVEIPLTEEDRFLTIATTEGDGEIGSDWCMFGRPTILLESK